MERISRGSAAKPAVIGVLTMIIGGGASSAKAAAVGLTHIVACLVRRRYVFAGFALVDAIPGAYARCHVPAAGRSSGAGAAKHSSTNCPVRSYWLLIDSR